MGTSNSNIAQYVVQEIANKIMFRTGINIGDGQVVITEYDDVDKTISGTFKFNAKNTNNNSLANPNLNFQKGFFYKVPISNGSLNSGALDY